MWLLFAHESGWRTRLEAEVGYWRVLPDGCECVHLRERMARRGSVCVFVCVGEREDTIQWCCLPLSLSIFLSPLCV